MWFGACGLDILHPDTHVWTHPHPQLSVEASLEWGGRWADGVAFNLTFLPFEARVFCIRHHHRTILSPQITYFIIKNKNKKSLRCTGHRKSPPAVFLRTLSGPHWEWASPLCEHRWSQSKLHPLSPKYIHCVIQLNQGFVLKEQYMFHHFLSAVKTTNNVLT